MGFTYTDFCLVSALPESTPSFWLQHLPTWKLWETLAPKGDCRPSGCSNLSRLGILEGPLGFTRGEVFHLIWELKGLADQRRWKVMATALKNQRVWCPRFQDAQPIHLRMGQQTGWPGAWGPGYKKTTVLLIHQANGWPKSFSKWRKPFSEYSVSPKLYINCGEGKCLWETKGEFIILLIYYHLPSEDNIKV